MDDITPVRNVAALKANLAEQERLLARSLTDAKAKGITVATAAQEGALRDIKALRETIADAEYEAQRSGTNNPDLTRIRKAAPMGLQSINEPATYTRHSQRSYVMDLVRSTMGWDTDGESRARLAAHAMDVASLPDYAEYRDLSRTEGSGGYAVPPAWLMDQYIRLARPSRAFANTVQNLPLPGGTDSINIPRMKTGTAVGMQPADLAAVVEVDASDDFINCPVKTIAGQQGLAIQLIDQSPIAFDEVVFADLAAAHAGLTDTEILSGTGTGGRVKGLLATAGIQQITPSAITPKGVYSAIANAVQQVHTQRFQPPTAIICHPRRWGWFLSLLDQQDRPLFLPSAAAVNAMGVAETVASEQIVGSMHGLPVITDPNIPTNLGTGTNEDCIIVTRASDLFLYESGVRTRVLPETRATNLSVLLQLYSYVAWTAERYTASTIVVSGLTPPVFA